MHVLCFPFRKCCYWRGSMTTGEGSYGFSLGNFRAWKMVPLFLPITLAMMTDFQNHFTDLNFVLDIVKSQVNIRSHFERVATHSAE